MNDNINNLNKKINYKNQYNSKQTIPKNTLNLNQIYKSPFSNKVNNSKKSRTSLSSDAASKRNKILYKSTCKSILKEYKIKFNISKNLEIKKKTKSLSKGTNGNKLKKIKGNISFNSNLPKSMTQKNNRSKSLSTKLHPSNLSFKSILDEFIPVVAKALNFPKNGKLKDIFKRININIDNRTFIRIKYIKKTGVLLIKFRNIFYYNYYYSLFKDRKIYKNLPNIKMYKIEEDILLWQKNSEEEDMTFSHINEGNNFIYENHVKIAFCNLKPI